MKLSKVLLSSAVAAALVFGFAGCKADDSENAFSGKKVDFNNAYVTVADDGTVKNAKETDKNAIENKEEYYYRAFNKLAQKHYGSTCVITLTPQSATKYDGVAGFVFDMTENDDKTYNFLIASVRYDPSTKKLGTYISKFTKALIKDNNFSKASNFTDINGNKLSTSATSTGALEKELVKGADGSTYYNFKETDFAIDATTGNLVVVVKVTQDESTGDYNVSYYKSLEDSKTDTNVVESFKINDSETAESGYNQEKMAMYVNIYPGQHFVGEFAFKDTVGNDIPFEDDVIIE